MPRKTLVAEEGELAEHGQRKVVNVQGIEIGIFNQEGEYYAVANHCVHQGGPLCEGDISTGYDLDEDGELVYDREDRVIECPWHRWSFDITTGKSTVAESVSVPTFETEIVDGDVYVVL